MAIVTLHFQSRVQIFFMRRVGNYRIWLYNENTYLDKVHKLGVNQKVVCLCFVMPGLFSLSAIEVVYNRLDCNNVDQAYTDIPSDPHLTGQTLF